MSQYLMSEEGVGSGEGGERTSFARQYASKNRMQPLEDFSKKWLQNTSARAAAADIRSDEEQRMVKEVQKKKAIQGLQAGEEAPQEQVPGPVASMGGAFGGAFGNSAEGDALGSFANYALPTLAAGAALNPFMAIGIPLLSYFSSKEKREEQDKERARIENNNREMRKMQARSDFMQGMRDVYRTQANRRLNL